MDGKTILKGIRTSHIEKTIWNVNKTKKAPRSSGDAFMRLTHQLMDGKKEV